MRKMDDMNEAFALCRALDKPIIVEVNAEAWQVFPSGRSVRANNAQFMPIDLKEKDEAHPIFFDPEVAEMLVRSEETRSKAIPLADVLEMIDQKKSVSA
jgi:hypothetical protein